MQEICYVRSGFGVVVFSEAGYLGVRCCKVFIDKWEKVAAVTPDKGML